MVSAKEYRCIYPNKWLFASYYIIARGWQCLKPLCINQFCNVVLSNVIALNIRKTTFGSNKQDINRPLKFYFIFHKIS